jgi:hypothetical protein
MAGAGRSWSKALAAGAVLVAAETIAVGQSAQSGSLMGKLTDLHSAPLVGVAVVVRNEATGAEARTTTAKNGSYRFAGLDVGAYTLEAESAQLGHGRLEGIYVSAGHEARVQAAMEFEIAPGRPIQLAAHDIATVTPELNTPVAADTMQQLPLTGRRAADVARKMPATVTAVVTEALPAEALRGLPVTGRLSQDTAPLASASAGAGKIGAEAAPTSLRASGQNAASHTSAAGAQELAIVNAEAVPAAPASARLADSAPGRGSAPRGSSGAGAPGAGGTASLGISQPLVSCGGLAMNETAPGAIRPAIEFIQPAPKRIQAASQRVDPVTPVVTTTVTAEQLQALPVTGRRWQDFALDTPTAATPAGGTSQTSLRGAGQQPAETTIDGAGTRLAFGGSGGSGPGSSGPGSNGQGGAEQNGMGRAWAGGHGAQVAEAAIRAVETAAGNIEAEGARAAGGRTNVETQRGTNGLHGQGFLFDRQNTWGAQNPFTQWVKETAPATLITSPVFTAESYTPPDHETVWGIGLGSQIRRDKMFWFAALDWNQRNDPGLATVKNPGEFFAQPSNDQMQVLSARLGLGGANPVAEGLAAYSTMLETLDGLLGPAPRTAAQWVGFSRIDWKAAERHRFTLEGIGARWNSPGGGLTRVSESYGTNSFGSSQANEEWLMGRWEAFLTPNLMAVTQGSAGRNILSAHAETPSAFEQTFLSPSVWGQLPQMVVDSRYGFTIGNPSRFGRGSYPDERLYEGQESVDWVRGSLLVKAGFDLSHNSDATSLLRNQTGTYYYSSVENFASDALVFAAYGVSGELNPDNQHNCDQTGKVWRDSGGTLRGLGYLPCYSYYSQVMGPTNWYLSTNDWAGFATAQWQPKKLLVVSSGLRWEREQLPPPLANLANAELPLTEKLPSLGNNWGPRLSLALGNTEGHLPVLRLGYGMYFGRTENATVETALTQTGSPNGDLNFFLRPTDNLNAGGAPPFPYVLSGEPGSVVKPGAVEFGPNFRNPEVDQAVAALEEMLPGRVELTASALVSLGRRLPVSIDTNFDPTVNPGTITYGVVDGAGAGPIKTPQITVPFYASWPSATSGTGFAGRLNPDYQQISGITAVRLQVEQIQLVANIA